MNEIFYRLIIRALMLFIAVMVGILCFVLGKKDLKKGVRDFYEKKRKEHYDSIKKKPDKLSAYDALEEQILEMGIKYRMGIDFSPFDYMVLRIAVGLSVSLLMMLVKPILAIIGVIVGVWIVPGYFKHEDKCDNRDMLSDIGEMYGILGLQLKNGVYLTNVIYECFITVEQPRLKKALLELTQDIRTFSSKKDAIERFGKKFNNEYIDIFVNSLEQAEHTGNVIGLLEDMSENMDSINKALAKGEKGKMNLRGFIMMSVLFVSLLIPAMYIYFVYGLSDAGTLL